MNCSEPGFTLAIVHAIRSSSYQSSKSICRWQPKIRNCTVPVIQEFILKDFVFINRFQFLVVLTRVSVFLNLHLPTLHLLICLWHIAVCQAAGKRRKKAATTGCLFIAALQKRKLHHICVSVLAVFIIVVCKY